MDYKLTARQPITLTIQDITRHRRLLNYIQLLYRHTSLKKSFSPLSCQILQLLPPLSFVPAFFQIYTLCRYNELAQLPIELIKSREPLIIKSSKSKHKRTVDPLPVFKYNLLGSLDPRTYISVVSYDKYKSDIKKSKRYLNLPEKIGILDCTHIFRHIEATFKFSKGVEKKQIGYLLGHSNIKTTDSYIHKLSDFKSQKS